MVIDVVCGKFQKVWDWAVGKEGRPAGRVAGRKRVAGIVLRVLCLPPRDRYKKKLERRCWIMLRELFAAIRPHKGVRKALVIICSIKG